MALTVGSVVRIRLAATVTSVDATSITVTSFGGTPVTFPKAIGNDPGFAYEDAVAPEPAYLSGQVYQDVNGGLFQYTGSPLPGDRWRVLLSGRAAPGSYVGENFPVRPLTHLVPENPTPPIVTP